MTATEFFFDWHWNGLVISCWVFIIAALFYTARYEFTDKPLDRALALSLGGCFLAAYATDFFLHVR